MSDKTRKKLSREPRAFCALGWPKEGEGSMTDDELIQRMNDRICELSFEWQLEYAKATLESGRRGGFDFSRLDAIRAEMDDIEDMKEMALLSLEEGQGEGGNENDRQKEV